ncbi:putative immunoglobulin-blocking virulence protein [Mycoplasmopsis mustelae]|uniref:Putative immunoglobulin-blocking virulence protein n=1 Tax=Mycoplasmopsis mustelae TaxID=171289 RepID=A0A4R7UCH7_9BACT|nr:putative immunoglobulin-blocking virulence protein [Mycoplasmopsis mustelae]TDV24128.1 putative immunoglobulin-blocking virulence protein [Mycoplasmopsis mustelae]
MKKRVLKINLIVLGAVLSSSVAGSVALANLTQTSASINYDNDLNSVPVIDARDNLDLKNGINSAKDFGLEQKSKVKEPEQPKPKEPIKIVEQPIEVKPIEQKPKPEIKPVPIPKPDQPKPQTKPSTPTIPVPPKPEVKQEVKPVPVPKPAVITPKPGTVKQVVSTDAGTFTVETQPLPPRVDKRSDVEKGIVNRVPYVAELTPDISNVTVTEANIKASVANGVKSLSQFNKLWTGIPGDRKSIGATYFDDYKRDGNAIIQTHLDNSPNELDLILQLWFKYRQLIESGNAKKYMFDSQQQYYEQWYNMPDTLSYIPPRGYDRTTLKVGHLWIAFNIDANKLTEVAPSVKADLSKGLYIGADDRNTYVNAQGQIDSYTRTPIFNKVTSEITRNNTQKRVFGFNSIYNRPGGQIESGDIPGWTKSNVTSQYEGKYGFSNSDGIKFTHYTRNADNNIPSNRKEATVVTVDFANESGYQKAKELIQKLVQNNEQITGYRFTNIGLSNSRQKIKDILSVLPHKLPLLELFFEGYNTDGLEALQDKEIDELGLYTSQNSLDERWAINPWALKNVAWVNTQDYNVSFDYAKNARVFTRITFDSLAFDEEDWVSEEDLTKINNGLRMAYVTRNNERIFQGSFGPGLKPDRNASGNSYPTGLDLSRIPQAKGLKNMIFYDEDKGQGSLRKLKRIVLYNNSETWETDTENMNLAQFDAILDKQTPMPRSKIIFSNGKGTKNILIKPKAQGATLNSTGLANLSTLINFSNGTFSGDKFKIFVPNNEVNLYNQLKSAGYRVDYQSNNLEFN